MTTSAINEQKFIEVFETLDFYPTRDAERTVWGWMEDDGAEDEEFNDYWVQWLAYCGDGVKEVKGLIDTYGEEVVRNKLEKYFSVDPEGDAEGLADIYMKAANTVFLRDIKRK